MVLAQENERRVPIFMKTLGQFPIQIASFCSLVGAESGVHIRIRFSQMMQIECYVTNMGQTKLAASYVVMESAAGKNEKEDT
jgi:hypothetical protein